jgi:hypothetical protein
VTSGRREEIAEKRFIARQAASTSRSQGSNQRVYDAADHPAARRADAISAWRANAAIAQV